MIAEVTIGVDTLSDTAICGSEGSKMLVASGPVAESETAPSKRWVRVEPRKPTPFADKPDLKDGVVYVDEFVHFLGQLYNRDVTEEDTVTVIHFSEIRSSV